MVAFSSLTILFILLEGLKTPNQLHQSRLKQLLLFPCLDHKQFFICINNVLNDSDIAESKVFKSDFLNQYVTYGRLGDISISFGNIETVTEVVGGKTFKYPKLTNVKVSLTGNGDTLTTAGYENTITTDIVFRAQNPGTGTPPTNDDSFAYDISRYVVRHILP